MHPMAHEIIMSTAATRQFFGRRGVVDATRDNARRVLGEWRRDLMVMPGGDVDAWRPYNRRMQVEFDGRIGYAHLARELNVPLVPVAHRGAHETLYVITDGRRLAKFIGLPSFARASIFPVHVSLPWGLAVGPWPHIPWPARFRYRVGAPINPGDYDSAEAVDVAVRAAIQQQLDELADA